MLLLAKLGLQLCLFTAFLYLYGLPALERLDRKRTMVLESRKKTNGIEAPSITIVAQSPETGMGWKVTTDESTTAPRNDILKIQCKTFRNVEQCLHANSFAKSDFIKDILVGYDSKIWSDLIWSDLIWFHLRQVWLDLHGQPRNQDRSQCRKRSTSSDFKLHFYLRHLYSPEELLCHELQPAELAFHT